MFNFLLVLHFILICCLTILVILQKNSDISILSNSGRGLISGKTSNKLLVKLTVMVATGFMINSLALAKMTMRDANEAKSIIESLPTSSPVHNIQHQRETIDNPVVPQAE